MEYPKKIKALVDYPNGGAVRKGEIGIYTGDLCYYNFPSQKHYGVYIDLIGTKYEIVDEPQYEIY